MACRLPWCTSVTIPLRSLVEGASHSLDDDSIRLVPDWLLFHPRVSEASHDWVAVVHEVGSAGAVVLLRALQMIVSVAADLDPHVRVAFEHLHPVLMASAPCLVQKSSLADDGRDDREAANLHVKMRDHFLRWVLERCNDAVLKHLIRRQAACNPHAKLFAVSIAEHAPPETSSYLFSALTASDPFIAASAFVAAVGECQCTEAAGLLRIFMTANEVGYGCGQHLHPTMRACVPYLVEKMARVLRGSHSAPGDTLEPGTDAATVKSVADSALDSVFRDLCEHPGMDGELHGIWKRVGSAVVSKSTPYHPAMCG